MQIAEIWRYPVKSMAGERLRATRLTDGGIPGDRQIVVVDRRGRIVTARTRPRLLALHPTHGEDGDVLVEGLPWWHSAIAAAVRAAAGEDAHLMRVDGPERFDVLPLLVATDGALAIFGHDRRRLRPNVVIAGVDGEAERGWEWRCLDTGGVAIALADLRRRCIMTTWDPDTQVQDLDVLRHIHARFDSRLALNAWTARPGPIAVGDTVRLGACLADLALPAGGRYARPEPPAGRQTPLGPPPRRCGIAQT